MAIYHFSLQIAKRNGGSRSLIAMAAYRSGERLYNELYGKINYYGHREIQPISFIIKPEKVPLIYTNREYLWNEMEKAETLANSQLCREINVALPAELSKENNIELTKKYVEKNFVSKGMIADVSIHYDDPNNPHFHVMLPMRKVDEEGNILNKRKRIELLDEEGNVMVNEKGHRQTISIKTTDWDQRSHLVEWRKNWADMVNEELEKNGFSQRISEKSHEELGLDLLPTKHEGYYTKKLQEQGVDSELRKQNNEIRQDNQLLVKIKEKEDQRNMLAANKDLKRELMRNLSPMEKRQMSELAKELRMYISPDSVNKRMEQLKRWENFVLFSNNKDMQSRRLKLNKITDTKEKLEQANELLDKQAQRFVEKHYAQYDFSHLERADIRAIAEETISQNKLFSQEKLIDIVETNRFLETEKVAHTFTEKPFMTDKYLRKKIETLDGKIRREGRQEEREILKQERRHCEKLKNTLETHIKQEVSQTFGKGLKLKSIIHGEMLLASKDYYGNTNLAENLQTSRYSPEMLNSMLDASRGYLGNLGEFEGFGNPQGVYFIRDCGNHLPYLTSQAKWNLLKMVKQNDYLPEKDKAFIKRTIEKTQNHTVEKQTKEDGFFEGLEIVGVILSLAKAIEGREQKQRELENEDQLSRQAKERRARQKQKRWVERDH